MDLAESRCLFWPRMSYQKWDSFGSTRTTVSLSSEMSLGLFFFHKLSHHISSSHRGAASRSAGSSGGHKSTLIANKQSPESSTSCRPSHGHHTGPSVIQGGGKVPNCFMCCFKHSLRTSSSPTPSLLCVPGLPCSTSPPFTLFRSPAYGQLLARL